MQTISERQARDAAFGLLAATVAEYEAQGRIVLGAPLKVALQRRSSGWFDETKLGYARFKRFLEAARDAGIVNFEPTEGGDLRVFTGDTRGESTSVVRRVRQPRPRAVRGDVWRAFFDWRPAGSRWYDRDEDRAVVLNGEAEVLAHLKGRPRDRLVPIEPITTETQLAWMRDFAATRTSEDRQVLQAALDDPRPLSAFTRSAHELGVYNDWNSERQGRIIESIRSWMAGHGIELALFTPVNRTSTAITTMGRTEEELRPLLHAAIDRMPASELLRLSVPLEYLLP